jgi:hypothetical protein
MSTKKYYFKYLLFSNRISAMQSNTNYTQQVIHFYILRLIRCFWITFYFNLNTICILFLLTIFVYKLIEKKK